MNESILLPIIRPRFAFFGFVFIAVYGIPLGNGEMSLGSDKVE